MKKRRNVGERELTGFAARNEMRCPGRNHLGDVVNEPFAHRGRDWARVAFSTRDAGHQFGRRGHDPGGINAKWTAVHHMLRDVKTRR